MISSPYSLVAWVFAAHNAATLLAFLIFSAKLAFGKRDTVWRVLFLTFTFAYVLTALSQLRRGQIPFIPYEKVEVSELDGHPFYEIEQSLSFDYMSLGLAVASFIALRRSEKKPIQSIQHNAGSCPSSDDSPASETPSAPAPRG